MQQKVQKKLVSEIIASELVSLDSFYLKTGYFSSTPNVLTSSPKIYYVNKRKFFEHNFLASDQ